MRAKTIDLIQDTAGKFVHFNANDMPDFVRDLVGSKKQKSTFGNRCESKIDHKEIFLPNLAAEYKSSEDKETNKEIPRQMSKQNKKSYTGHCGTVVFLYLVQHQMYSSHEWMLPKA